MKNTSMENKLYEDFPKYALSITISSDYGDFVIDENTRRDTSQKSAVSLPFGSVNVRVTDVDGFQERLVRLDCDKDVVLTRVSAKFIFEEVPSEYFLYSTFRDASAFSLLRFKENSLIVGFCNPVFDLHVNGNVVEITFQPSLKLSEGERFDLDPLFIGVAKRSGDIVKVQTPITANRVNGVYHTRYHNPCEKIELDRAEMNAFTAYLDEYLKPYCDSLKVVFYTYFSPFPQLISTDEEEEIYYRYIDNFAKIGGDLIIFNPIQRFIQPVPNKESRWIIAPNGSRADRILSYCKKNNIGYGFTWGSAVLNTNSPMTSYTLAGERNHWKKIGKDGEISRENCIADEDFYDWFKQVQINTIREYKIDLWDWDPGPGNASFCYSANHGHIPGEGYYKGYRQAMRMIAEMKDECPKLLVQSFHGLKEYGVWGMKGVDWHESYWEQDPYFFAAAYPDFSADRYTASGMRMQCWWNRNFRFLPSNLNQFMASRMIQNCGYPQFLRHLFDFYGYKYALMSAIACGGSITLPMLPENIDIADYHSFYKKWIGWAKKHYEYNAHTVCFGAQVAVNGIDGYAKFKGDDGYIFLCNPAPFEVDFAFDLDEKIGFLGTDKYNLRQIYPDNGSIFCDEKTLRYTFVNGDSIHVKVPAYQILLFEVLKEQDNLLFNVDGTAHIDGDTCYASINGVEGDKRLIAIKANESLRKLIVNGASLPFKQVNDVVTASILFGQEQHRQIGEFTCNEEVYSVPFKISAGKTYKADVLIGKDVCNLLVDGGKMMSAEMRQAVEDAKKLGNDSYLWTQPDKLYLCVTFLDARDVGDVELSLNGKKLILSAQKVPAHGFCDDFIVGYYVDVTNEVVYGQLNSFEVTTTRGGEFLGIQLYYPEGKRTDKIIPFENCKTPTVKEVKVIAQKLEKSNALRHCMVNKGWIKEGYIQEYNEFTLLVDVNLPFEEIEGVYCTNPINIDDSKMTLMTDNRLTYDFSTKLWKKTFRMGTRQFLIIDEEFLSVWAVAKNGEISDRYRVRIEWKLF